MGSSGYGQSDITGKVTVSEDRGVNYDANVEKLRAATVRIRNGNALGTGTFFREDDTNYYILSNAHVGGRKNNTVDIQMWSFGKIAPNTVRGKVVFSTLVRNYYRDVSVIAVAKSDMGGYEPPVIALAESDFNVDWRACVSVGCAAGRWQTGWQGEVLHQRSDSGDVVEFTPKPAGGRSGSALFSRDGSRIIGLIAWNAQAPASEHSLDGDGKRPGIGIAMTFREVIVALTGQGRIYGSGFKPASHTPIQLEDQLPDGSRNLLYIDPDTGNAAVYIQPIIQDDPNGERFLPFGPRRQQENSPKPPFGESPFGFNDRPRINPEVPRIKPDIPKILPDLPKMKPEEDPKPEPKEDLKEEAPIDPEFKDGPRDAPSQGKLNKALDWIEVNWMLSLGGLAFFLFMMKDSKILSGSVGFVTRQFNNRYVKVKFSDMLRENLEDPEFRKALQSKICED